MAWLLNWRWPNGRRCPQCGFGEFYEIAARKAYGSSYSRCKRCLSDYTWSSRTLLASGKMRASIYVAAITFARGRLCSANFFASVVGIQSSAATKLFWKIRCASVEVEVDVRRAVEGEPS